MPVFSSRARLMTSTSPLALAGRGIGGSNYVEFQFPPMAILPTWFEESVP